MAATNKIAMFFYS